MLSTLPAKLTLRQVASLRPEEVAALRTRLVEEKLTREHDSGVQRKGRKWEARPFVAGRRVYIGLFASEEAALAACRAKRREVLLGGQVIGSGATSTPGTVQ